MAQLRSQLDAVVMERDFARTLRGKISPVTTHAQGPQLLAKKNIYIHTKATRACWAGRLETGSAVPIAATTGDCVSGNPQGLGWRRLTELADCHANSAEEQ